MADRNTHIKREQLEPIRTDDFDATNSPGIGQVPSVATDGQFEWVDMGTGGTGGGDMMKETYDIDDDGIVDKAEVVDDGASGGIHSSSAIDIRDAVDKKHDIQTADTVPTEDSGISVQDALNTLEIDQHTHSNKTQLDLVTDGDHDVRTDNPHSVTKTQVGLGNVTDDAQIKEDISSYTEKTTPADDDLLVLEDSEVSGTPIKKVKKSNIVPAVDNFTIINDEGTLKIADRIELNIMLNFFRDSINNGNVKFNLADGFIDEFEDESGIDTTNSTNESYNSSGDYYTPSQNANVEIDYMEYATDELVKSAYVSSDPDVSGGIDEYNKLNLHFNGNNGAKEIVDSGNTGHIVTQVGTATLSIAQKKIGSTSLLLDGNSDYLTVPDHADWYFGTDPFTIEGWFRFNAIGTDYQLWGQENIADEAVAMYYFQITAANKLMFMAYASGYKADYITTSAIPSFTAGIWYHIAVVRNGTSLYIFVNGVSLPLDANTAVGTNAIPDSDGKLTVGARLYHNTTVMQPFNGYIDEVRISKGIARWTSDFTPSIIAYTSDEYTKLLLHMDTLDYSGDYTGNTYKIPTFVGTAQLSTAQKEFGSASLLLDGNSDYVTVPDSADFAFGAGAFTLDCWVRPTQAAGYHVIVDTAPADGTTGVMVGIDANNYAYVYVNGFVIQGNDAISGWAHIAVVGNGGANGARTIKLYVNGTQDGSTWTNDYNFTDDTCAIGDYIVAHNAQFNGYIDEFRISKGIARWTTTFTPPTVEYTTTIPGNLQSYSEATIKNQGTYSLKAIAKITDSLNDTLTKTLESGSHIDLTSYNTIKLDIYASRTGQNLQLQIHDSGGTTSTYDITVSTANTWETKTWDISGISDANKNDIDSIIIKVTNADAENTFYIDNVYAVGEMLNMTLLSNKVVAESVPSQARIVLFEQDVDAITLNTDLKAYASRDDGTTWTQLTLIDEGDYDTNCRILSAEPTDISAQPSDTDMKIKLTTHNAKNCKIHGQSLQWNT